MKEQIARMWFGTMCSGVHGQLEPLLNVDLDSAIVVLIQGLEGTAHGIQSDQTANVVVEVHIPLLITVPANDHLEQRVVQGEACRSERIRQLISTDDSRTVSIILLVHTLPFLNVVPEVFEFMEAQLSCAVTIHDCHHTPTGLNTKSICLQVRVFRNDSVQDVHQLVGAHLHIITSQLLEDFTELSLFIALILLCICKGPTRWRRV